MIEGNLVIDATVHAFNFREDNLRQPFVSDVIRGLYHWVYHQLGPQDDPRHRITFDQFQNLFDHQPQVMEEVVFRESDVDIAAYHGVPMYGFFGDGSSPIHIAEAIKARYDHRMLIYGGLSPWEEDPHGKLVSLLDEHKVAGIKLYPADIVEGELKRIRLDDEKRMFPLFETARAKGLKVIAMHKALPLGPITIDHYHLDDVEAALVAFPELTFEIVHGGLAYLDETVRLLERYPNISVNLEAAPCYAINHGDRFAEMMAPLIGSGGHDRIFFSTGATGVHPQPFLEAFWRYEMPRGYPPLTPEIKIGILGANFARQHGLDVEELKRQCLADDIGRANRKSEPWAWLRSQTATRSAA